MNQPIPITSVAEHYRDCRNCAYASHNRVGGHYCFTSTIPIEDYELDTIAATPCSRWKKEVVHKVWGE